jgi:uncharacterized membrane protein
MAIDHKRRIQSIDLLRGIVMIIMALDHSRDFIHYGNSIDLDPLDLATTTPLLFMTRWITHFCAPVFVFLSGTSVFLYASKGKTKKQVALFLLTRGLFLMAAQIVIMAPVWDATYRVINLQVIWAIGLCMVCLSILQFISYRILLGIGLLIVFAHNLLDNIIIHAPVWKSFLWSTVHQEHQFLVNEHLLVIMQYPFLPLLGLMILGYCTGKLYMTEIKAVQRKKILRNTGVASIILFIVIRWLNVYGDLHPWHMQKTTLLTIFDFVNTTKYPASLQFILMTMGPALILLSSIENFAGSIGRKIMVFGKVPFFFYVLHVFVLHSIAFILFFARGHSWSDLDFIHFREGSLPYGSGHPLWMVYVVWIGVVLALYLPCRWYGKYKSTHKHWWLSYF